MTHNALWICVVNPRDRVSHYSYSVSIVSDVPGKGCLRQCSGDPGRAALPSGRGVDCSGKGTWAAGGLVVVLPTRQTWHSPCQPASGSCGGAWPWRWTAPAQWQRPMCGQLETTQLAAWTLQGECSLFRLSGSFINPDDLQGPVLLPLMSVSVTAELSLIRTHKLDFILRDPSLFDKHSGWF